MINWSIIDNWNLIRLQPFIYEIAPIHQNGRVLMFYWQRGNFCMKMRLWRLIHIKICGLIRVYCLKNISRKQAQIINKMLSTLPWAGTPATCGWCCCCWTCICWSCCKSISILGSIAWSWGWKSIAEVNQINSDLIDSVYSQSLVRYLVWIDFDYI